MGGSSNWSPCGIGCSVIGSIRSIKGSNGFGAEAPTQYGSAIHSCISPSDSKSLSTSRSRRSEHCVSTLVASSETTLGFAAISMCWPFCRWTSWGQWNNPWSVQVEQSQVRMQSISGSIQSKSSDVTSSLISKVPISLLSGVATLISTTTISKGGAVWHGMMWVWIIALPMFGVGSIGTT